MQAPYSCLGSTIDELERSLSSARLSTFVRAAGGDRQLAVRLHRWNSSISQSLYFPLQYLEIACRNGIRRALSDKFGDLWHLDARFHAVLGPRGATDLGKAVERQRRRRGEHDPPLDAVIADLSFGFWSEILTRRYEVPLGWHRRLRIAFPDLDPGTSRDRVSRPLDAARDLRNRIAHHEPLIGVRLAVRHDDMMEVLGWASPATRWFVERHGTFARVWDAHPAPHLRRD